MVVAEVLCDVDFEEKYFIDIRIEMVRMNMSKLTS